MPNATDFAYIRHFHCVIWLIPMIDCEDTETSKNNRSLVWNTRRNNYGWRKYLGVAVGKENGFGFPTAHHETAVGSSRNLSMPCVLCAVFAGGDAGVFAEGS